MTTAMPSRTRSALTGVDLEMATLVYSWPTAAPSARQDAALQLVSAGILAPRTTPPTARCDCGGFLARVGRSYLHVDTCDEEVYDRVTTEWWNIRIVDGMLLEWPGVARYVRSTSLAERCPDDGHGHKACTRPKPTTCEHSACSQVGSLDIPDCPYGHDTCCGCCGEESC